MKFSKVQIALIVIALAATLVAVLIFARVIPGFGPSGQKETRQISMWGTFPARILEESLQDLGRPPKNIKVSYEEKDPATFEAELIDALARQAGPDLVIFPADFILKHKDKLSPIPSEFVSERLFRDTFADGTESLILSEGIIGLPFLIDPLVFYYNRDLFRNETVSQPPKTWDEFLVTSQKLTKLDSVGVLARSGAALGLESNVRNFKEILSLLILQAGSPLIDPATLKVVFRPPSQPSGPDPVESALRFYTEFSNPQKASYSWSRLLTNSREAFSQEILAMYFGFGSESAAIRQLNPHLNFDLAGVPQIKGGKLNLTYGRLFSLGIVKQSRASEASLEAVKFLIEREQLLKTSQSLGLAPSRRDLLSQKPGNPVLETIFREAIKFKTWLDIDSVKTSEIFSQMIKSVHSGSKTENQASRDAKIQFEALYNP